jgi:DNA-binding NarL/FixJ family response regulator
LDTLSPVSLKILVADDHVLVAEAFQRLLEAEGWEARVANSPEAADSVLKHWTPDVALLDIEFRGSGRTGFDLARTIASSYPRTRTLILTMHGDSVFPEMASKAGAAGFLSKCARSATLIDAVKAVAAGGNWFPELSPAMRHGLTPRQLEVTRYLAQGFHYEEIAAAMNCGERTVRFHVRRAEVACGARTTAELVGIARERGWFLLPARTSGAKPS